METTLETAAPREVYHFAQNDPYDRSAAIQLVVPQRISSRDYMRSIRDFQVPQGSIAVWFLGQNSFLLKDATSPLIGIDLYLSNSCAAIPGLPFRLDRQLPIFIEPEDLDVDVFIATHSHQDHADPETIRRVPKTGNTVFLGPFDAVRIFRECGVPADATRLIHAGETLPFGSATVQATFALPTDATDLNHTGMLITFAGGLTFYNSGDTAWAERLPSLLPANVDVCTICINGGFHNLVPMLAAAIIKEIKPKVAIPCHYDMMINNIGSPGMLKVALDIVGATAKYHMLTYYEPWLYQRAGES